MLVQSTTVELAHAPTATATVNFVDSFVAAATFLPSATYTMRLDFNSDILTFQLHKQSDDNDMLIITESHFTIARKTFPYNPAIITRKASQRES